MNARFFVAVCAIGLQFGARPALAEQISTVAPLRWHIGGGNLDTQGVGDKNANTYAALRGIGAKLGRMNSYDWRDANGVATPQHFDAAMREAQAQGITPIVLFEYYGNYQKLTPPQQTGSYDQWVQIGLAYAKRFQPNGDWAKEHKIADWGASVFTFANEPDVESSIDKTVYHDALKGLADGVHSVNPALKVLPAGFATCNSHADASLRGYGPAIADLLEDGHLDGIDLHTYYNARWFPLTKGRYFSAQSCFDRIKKALGLTRDIHFYATEFNIAQENVWSDPKTAASLFLTAFWDEVGVVGADRHSPVSVLAFPWNLGDTAKSENPQYAMALGQRPWVPDLRAQVLKNILHLAGDMRFLSLDPLGSGTFTLAGASGQLQVWQNRPDWTDHPGAEWELSVPVWAREAELWGWSGHLRSAKVTNGKVRFDNLPMSETYMVFIPKPLD